MDMNLYKLNHIIYDLVGFIFLTCHYGYVYTRQNDKNHNYHEILFMINFMLPSSILKTSQEKKCDIQYLITSKLHLHISSEEKSLYQMADKENMWLLAAIIAGWYLYFKSEL